MKRNLLLIGLFLLAGAVLIACQPAATPTEEPAPVVEEKTLLEDIKDKGVIRVSTDPNYAPQSFLEPDGTFVGFDVDVANEIGDRLGVEVEFVTPDWDVITAGNWGDQWDISVGSMTITNSRMEILHFVRPAYYYTPAQFAAANGSGINTFEDVAGQPVCMGSATTYESYLLGDLNNVLPGGSIYMDAPDV